MMNETPTSGLMSTRVAGDFRHWQRLLPLAGFLLVELILVVVAYQFFRKDASKTDLALAVLGAIPFGSAGKLFQGKGGVMSFLGDALPVSKSSYSAAAGQLNNMRMASNFAGGGFKGFVQGGRTMWQLNNPAGVGDVATRLFLGKDVKTVAALTDTMTGASRGFARSTTLPAVWEFTHMVIGAPVKMTDKIATWTGHGDKAVSKKVPWLGAVL